MPNVYTVWSYWESQPVAAFASKRLAHDFLRSFGKDVPDEELTVKEGVDHAGGLPVLSESPQRVFLYEAEVSTSQPGGTAHGHIGSQRRWVGINPRNELAVDSAEVQPVIRAVAKRGYVEAAGYEFKAVQEAVESLALQHGVRRVTWDS